MSPNPNRSISSTKQIHLSPPKLSRLSIEPKSIMRPASALSFIPLNTQSTPRDNQPILTSRNNQSTASVRSGMGRGQGSTASQRSTLGRGFRGTDEEKPKPASLKQNQIMLWSRKNLHKRLEYAAFPIYERDVNIYDEIGNSPIFYAAKHGSLDLTKFFITKKAQINTQCQDGNTPMHMAFKSGNCTLICFLIQSGAGLNQTNNFSQTPIAFGTNKTLETLGLTQAVAECYDQQNADFDNHK